MLCSLPDLLSPLKIHEQKSLDPLKTQIFGLPPLPSLLPILFSSSRSGDSPWESQASRICQGEIWTYHPGSPQNAYIWLPTPQPPHFPSHPLFAVEILHACQICDANFQSDMRGRCQLSENADEIHQIYFRIKYPNWTDLCVKHSDSISGN